MNRRYFTNISGDSFQKGAYTVIIDGEGLLL